MCYETEFLECSLVVESDSALAIQWLNGGNAKPWQLADEFGKIEGQFLLTSAFFHSFGIPE